MIKKVITAAATLGLLVGIVNTAGAEELSRPALPIQGSATIESETPISIYNLQKYHEMTYSYPISEYQYGYNLPKTFYTSWSEGQYVWAGTLNRLSYKSNGDYWIVTFGGMVTRY